jgi:hypothetical protein
MQIGFKDSIELIKAIAWPVIVALALFTFRKPLYRLLEELGQRVTKLEIFKISFELAKLPNPPAPWTDAAIMGSTSLTGGYVTSTTIMELFRWIRERADWHYLIVDIGAGKRWLISRLFIFAVILQYLHGLRCIVFVETTGEHRRRLLGLANPEDVRLALAKKYPRLDQVLIRVWSAQDIPVLAKPLPSNKAESIVNGFMQDAQIQIKGFEDDLKEQPIWEDLQNEWENLGGTPSVWEHTRWLNIRRVNEDLRAVFYPRDVSQFVDSPELTVSQRNKAILSRKGPLVALTNDKEEFKALVDRQAFLDQMAAQLAEKSDEGSVPR